MPFARTLAADTLLSVSGILAEEKDGVPAELRRQIEALIRQYAPKIAAPATWGEDPVQGLLEAFWSLKDGFPPRARLALEAAWRPTEGPAMRGVSSIAESPRQAILTKLRQVYDYRVFIDPPALQAKVAALIREHQDRLTEDERKGWLTIEEAFKATRDAESYLRWVEAHLSGYPLVQQLLEKGKGDVPKLGLQAKGGLEPRPIMRGTSGPESYSSGASRNLRSIGGAPTPTEVGFPAGEGPATPSVQAKVDRYGNVYFPPQVTVNQRVPLIVHVARQLSTAAGQRIEAGEARMSLMPGPVTLVLTAEGLKVDDYVIGGEAVSGRPSARTIEVTEASDCEPVIYFLTAEAAGARKVSIDFYQFDRNIRTLAFTVDVVGAGTAITHLGNVVYDSEVPIASALAGKDAPPPDLELRVMLSDDKHTLMYMLHSPKGAGDVTYNFQPAGQVTLASEPAQYFKPRYDRLSDLAKLAEDDRGAAGTAAALQEIDEMGVELYNELFSDELKDAYEEFREAYAGKSLLITSDDPWVPWELVRPFKADKKGKVLYDDRPLCERFKVSRWLAGRGAPDRVSMKRGVWIAPPSNLSEVQTEKAYFEELHQRRWEITFSGPLEQVAQVESEFQAGTTELYHFSCHGGFDDKDPNESVLVLADDQVLSPRAIVGQKQAGLLRSKPVVFLNACHGGRVGVALTRLGGWAQRFLDSGASAFIGSQWEINDKLAAQFAVEFYNRLWGLGGCEKMSLGDAFYQARMEIKKSDPANPTWMAYVLYGDPYGQVLLGV